VDGSEEPNHEVTVGAFYIAKYPVTQKLWKAIMGNNPSNCIGDENVFLKPC
jgi:formylglycine-generating enzyme required for sulfatase activity